MAVVCRDDADLNSGDSAIWQHFLSRADRQKCGGNGDPVCLGYALAIAIMLFVAVLNTYGVKLLAECNKYASLIKFGVPSLAVASLLYTSPSFDNIQIHLST